VKSFPIEFTEAGCTFRQTEREGMIALYEVTGPPPRKLPRFSKLVSEDEQLKEANLRAVARVFCAFESKDSGKTIETSASGSWAQNERAAPVEKESPRPEGHRNRGTIKSSNGDANVSPSGRQRAAAGRARYRGLRSLGHGWPILRSTS
jgi:hypothetical protein